MFYSQQNIDNKGPQSGPPTGTPRLGHRHRGRVVVLARHLVVVQVRILSLAAAWVHVQLFIVGIRPSLCLRYLHNLPWVFYYWILIIHWRYNIVQYNIVTLLSGEDPKWRSFSNRWFISKTKSKLKGSPQMVAGRQGRNRERRWAETSGKINRQTVKQTNCQTERERQDLNTQRCKREPGADN